MTEVQIRHYRKILQSIFITDDILKTSCIRIKAFSASHFTDDDTIEQLKISQLSQAIKEVCHVCRGAAFRNIFKEKDAAFEILLSYI